MHTGITVKARTRNVSSVVGLVTVGLNNIVGQAVKSDITNYVPGKNTMFRMVVREQLEMYDVLDEVYDYYNKNIASTIMSKIPMLESANIAQVHDIIYGLRIENGSIMGIEMDITVRLSEVPTVPIFIKLFLSSVNENVAEMIDKLFDAMFVNSPYEDTEPHKATLMSRLHCTKIRIFFCKETFDICTSS